MVSVSYLAPLTQTTFAATFRLFPELFIEDTLSLDTEAPEKLIDPDLLSQLLSEEAILATSEDPLSSNGITEAVSENANLSLDSVVSSLTSVVAKST